MRFAVESWDPGYGVSGDETALVERDEPVDIAVETPGDRWVPVRPSPDRRPESLAFVDGVRRIDARIWVSEAPGLPSRPGVCATVAAGAVVCRDGGASVVAAEVERGLYTAASGASPVTTRHATYGLVPTIDDTDEAIYLRIHTQMTKLESTLSADLGSASEIVVFDGAIRGRTLANGIGYVKTQHVQYLPAPQHAVLGELGAGERTPLFLIGGRAPRWSWYVRLPGPVAHSLSGIVRLEAEGIGPAADAILLADRVTAALPHYASKPQHDARAPQNLYPIAGLERQLRRRLGDVKLLERSLRVAASART